MSPEERQKVNTLLAYLRQFGVKELIEDYFLKKHNNSAPGELYQQQVWAVQKLVEGK